MTFTKNIRVLICALFISYGGWAQITWSAPDLMVDSGDVVGVDFTLIGYQNVISAQGTLQFDSSILEYVSVGNFGLPSISAGSFGETEVDQGKLSFSWYESDLIGKDVADNATIITVYFNVIGNPGQMSALELIDQPVVVEFIDESFAPIPHNSQAGSVTVNSLAQLDGALITKKLKMFPNPTTDGLMVEGELKGVELEIYWYTLAGEMVKKENYSMTTNSMQLSTKELTTGSYVLRIGSEQFGFENHIILKR